MPARLVTPTLPVLTPVLGVMALTTGGGLSTRMPSERVPDWLSGLVTVTSHAPTAAPVKFTEQVIWVALTTTTEVAGMSVWPVFCSLTVAPAMNPVPERAVMLVVPLL